MLHPLNPSAMLNVELAPFQKNAPAPNLTYMLNGMILHLQKHFILHAGAPDAYSSNILATSSTRPWLSPSRLVVSQSLPSVAPKTTNLTTLPSSSMTRRPLRSSAHVRRICFASVSAMLTSMMALFGGDDEVAVLLLLLCAPRLRRRSADTPSRLW